MGLRDLLRDTFCDSPRPKPARNRHEEIVIQGQMFGVRLDEAPPMGVIGENLPERGKSPLLEVLGVCHFDPRVDFASSNEQSFGRGLSQERSRCHRYH